MNNESFKSIIKNLISENKIEEVVTELLERTIGNSELQNRVILLNSRYKDIRKKTGIGILSNNEESSESLRIKNSLLQLIDEVFASKSLLSEDLIEKSTENGRMVENIWFLIEDGPGFSTKLRNALYEKLADYSFNVRDYFREEKTYLADSNDALKLYYNAFLEFISDKSAKWLLTVFPEEERSSFLFRHEKRILDLLEKHNKFMICFESGYRLKAKAEDTFKFLKIIGSDHEWSIYLLLKCLIKQVENQERLHLVIIPGPKKNPIANERLKIKLEFAATLLSEQINHVINLIPSLEYESKFKDLIKSLERRFKSVHISTPYFNSWDRFEAKNKILEIIENLSIDDKKIHTAFLCVNDDVALGVKDAIDDFRTQHNRIHENVSIFGFDGISEMKEYISNGGIGGTMEVNIDYFCEAALKYISNKEPLDVSVEHKIVATSIVSNSR